MRRSILLIDDDPAICETLTEILEDYGCEVAVARDGRTALEYLGAQRDSPPGLILLDLMMPGMNGAQFLDEYRSHLEFPPVPVVVLSANPAMLGREHLRDVLLFLSKPVNVPHLLGTVDRWCA
jgi:CheY-like chemotaxis protein